jgi:hypothetical protein
MRNWEWLLAVVILMTASIYMGWFCMTALFSGLPWLEKVIVASLAAITFFILTKFLEKDD